MAAAALGVDGALPKPHVCVVVEPVVFGGVTAVIASPWVGAAVAAATSLADDSVHDDETAAVPKAI